MNPLELKQKATPLIKNFRRELINLITDFVQKYEIVDLIPLKDDYNINSYTELEYSEIRKEVLVFNTKNGFSRLKRLPTKSLIKLINTTIVESAH